MESPPPPPLEAVRAWLRLDQAITAFNRHLRDRHGVTGAQLAMLRIVAERPVTLAELRAGLAMHPATLGQLIDRLAAAFDDAIDLFGLKEWST